MTKEAPVHVFSSEFYETFLKMLFTEQLWRAQEPLLAC